MNGGSQAVRIPKDFRFDTAEVSVQPYGDGILLRPVRHKISLQEFFKQCDSLCAQEKRFLDERPCNSRPVERDLFK